MKIILFLSLIITILVSVIMSANPAFAWTSYTHKWICERAGIDAKYSGIDCATADYPSTQSKYHDASFVNHHCSYNATGCKARLIADKFLLNDTLDALGIAAHLYADSLVPVHWYSTDYDACHKIFEDKVEKRLQNSGKERYVLFGSSFDTSSWNITMQCVTTDKTHQTITLYADNNYMDDVARYVAGKIGSTPAEKGVKEYDLSPIFYFLVVFIILVLILFFYFGFKNKKRK